MNHKEPALYKSKDHLRYLLYTTGILNHKTRFDSASMQLTLKQNSKYTLTEAIKKLKERQEINKTLEDFLTNILENPNPLKKNKIEKITLNSLQYGKTIRKMDNPELFKKQYVPALIQTLKIIILN